jgi:hypothetical protein
MYHYALSLQPPDKVETLNPLAILEGGQRTRWITIHCTQEIPRGIMVGIEAICKARYGGAARTLCKERFNQLQYI